MVMATKRAMAMVTRITGDKEGNGEGSKSNNNNGKGGGQQRGQYDCKGGMSNGEGNEGG
jgi:hypothetical protein